MVVFNLLITFSSLNADYGKKRWRVVLSRGLIKLSCLDEPLRKGETTLKKSRVARKSLRKKESGELFKNCGIGSWAITKATLAIIDFFLKS